MRLGQANAPGKQSQPKGADMGATPKPTYTRSGKRYYKVLLNGRSFHGGILKWSLPNGQPGEWHGVEGRLSMCSHGIHITCEPAEWFARDAKVYAVEVEGDVVEDESDKIAVQRCRLLRELDEAELAELRIFLSGEHKVRDGKAWAYGSASVTASGSASVEASDSASVTASDSASVRAYGSASVTASDSASVRAYGSASVTAYGSASVRAYDSASVRAYGSASVRAYGSASVEAYDSASVSTWYGNPSVQLFHYAVLIDRRNQTTDGKPTVALAEGK